MNYDDKNKNNDTNSNDDMYLDEDHFDDHDLNNPDNDPLNTEENSDFDATVNFVIKEDPSTEAGHESMGENDFKTSYEEEPVSQYRKSYASIPEDIYIERKAQPKEKKRGFRGSMASYIILALVASIIGGFSSSFLAPLVLKNTDLAKDNPKADAITINTNDSISTVSAVVKKSMPSVVGITTLETRDNFFMEKELVEGIGSGVIIDSDGYILTNSHVIANGNAKEIKVLLNNADEVKAQLLWFDQGLDLAVIKVDVKGLTAMELGDSDSLEVGEIAIAIGNPLGLELQRTVTSGIISGLNRTIAIDRSSVIENLIQTDASINPGNSGGPLLNSKGQVIGINTAKTQGGQGLGFAIPINSTKAIIKEVIAKGTFETVQLGIHGRDVLEYQAINGIDLGLKEGVIVVQVLEESVAAKSGLLTSDIILKLDDKKVESMQTLKKMLYDYTKGDKATLTVLRNNKEEKINISF
nr:trypsin-like peptidase domain-containing protein [Tissierella sp.]